MSAPHQTTVGAGWVIRICIGILVSALIVASLIHAAFPGGL